MVNPFVGACCGTTVSTFHLAARPCVVMSESQALSSLLLPVGERWKQWSLS